MAHFDEVTKIWHGPKVIKSPRPFTTKLFEHLQKTPNKIAQISVYERTELTYNDLRLMSIRAAQNLIEIGVKPGDVVGIIARNSTFVAPVVFGCFLIGAPINSLDVSHKTEDIKHMWGITRPKLVFSDPEKVPLVQEAIKELKLNAKIFTFLENVKGCVSVSEILIKTGKEEVFKPKEFPLDSIVAVLCSSGTTGASKGIVCTQAHFNTTLKHWKIHESSRLFCTSSLYWLTGYFFLIIPIMGNGVRIICHVDVDIVEALDIFEDQQITDTFLPPGALANSMKSMEENEKKCFSMENVLCGGSLVYTSIRKNFHNYFPKSEMHVVYGATEINVTCSMFHDNKAEDTLSVGILKENVQIKILEDVNGTPLGINEVGEICVKAPDNVCKGYYKNDTNFVDSDGFFRPGDLGYFDELGYFYISDRRTDVIRVYNPNAFQVYPSTIENVAMTIKGVKEVCVVGVKHPVFIEIPAVMVIKDESSEVSEVEISAVLLKEIGLTIFGDEILIYFMDIFPKTPSGKVKRRLVKTMAIEKYNETHDYVL